MVVNLTRGLIDLGQAVDLVLMRRDGPHLERVPPAVRQLALGTPHSALAIPALARYLRRERPAALLAVKDRAGRSAVLARALAQTSTPILMRLGTHLSAAMAGKPAVQRWPRYALIRWLYPRVDRIIAVSEGVADDTAKIAHVARTRIEVVRNPTITPELASLGAADCGHPWLQPRQVPVILGAGRLGRQKDFATLIRAFAEVRRGRPCRLVILGEGRRRRGLEDLASRLGIHADVDLPGFQSNPYAFMSRAKLFVLSSAWEGSPNVLIEAMALGTPVVSTDCPSGPSELLRTTSVGSLVPVGDAEAMSRAMVATLDNPPPAERLKAAVAAYQQGLSARHYLQIIAAAVVQRDSCGHDSAG